MQKSLVRYLQHHRALGSSPKTIQNHDAVIRLFVRWCCQHEYPTDVNRLSADMVREWMVDMRARGLSDSTVATRVRSLKAFTNWLVEEEWLPKNPLTRVKMPRESDGIKDILSPTEVDALLRTCRAHAYGTERRDYAVMMLLWSTGVRASELLALRVGDIDIGKGLIVIRRGKGGKGRLVPLGSKLDRAMDCYLAERGEPKPETPLFLTDEGEPMTQSALREMLRRRPGRGQGQRAQVEALVRGTVPARRRRVGDAPGHHGPLDLRPDPALRATGGR